VESISAKRPVRSIPSTFNFIASALNTQGEHLGDLVWWNLADARIQRNFLERIWTESGLPLGHLPDPPSAEKALKTAVREYQVGKLDLLIRLGKECDTEVIFALLREHKDSAGNVRPDQEARVILRRADGNLSTDVPIRPDDDLSQASISDPRFDCRTSRPGAPSTRPTSSRPRCL